MVTDFKCPTNLNVSFSFICPQVIKPDLAFPFETAIQLSIIGPYQLVSQLSGNFHDSKFKSIPMANDVLSCFTIIACFYTFDRGQRSDIARHFNIMPQLMCLIYSLYRTIISGSPRNTNPMNNNFIQLLYLTKIKGLAVYNFIFI